MIGVGESEGRERGGDALKAQPKLLIVVKSRRVLQIFSAKAQ